MHRAVGQPVDRQVCGDVGMARRERLVERHAEAGLVSGMQVAVGEAVGVREDLVDERLVAVVLLDAEVAGSRTPTCSEAAMPTGEMSVAP